MRAIIQRVSSARLESDQIESDQNSAPRAIGRGLVTLIGVEKGDTLVSFRRMAERLSGYRVFPDAQGRMNLSLADIHGEMLLVPNFTVAADTKKGTRAGFSTAAEPAEGEAMFLVLVQEMAKQPVTLQTGIFAADMQITLTNDGPVTFILES